LRKVSVHFLEYLYIGSVQINACANPLESYKRPRIRILSNCLICAGASTPCRLPSHSHHSARLFPMVESRLDHEALDLVLEGADLAHEVGGLVGGDAAADDSAADTAGAAKSHLAGDVNLMM
jgi:hypothetical protein